MNRKLSFGLPLLYAVVLVLACDDKDVVPANEPALVPVRLEEPGYTLELMYNDKGQIERTKATGVMPDKDNIITLQEMFYDASGRLVRSTKDSEWRSEYHYEGDVVVRMEDFYKGAPHLDYRFTYDNQGRITETVAWKADGVPYSKTVNTWDGKGDLTIHQYYEFENGTFVLKYVNELSGYDDKVSVDELFNVSTLGRNGQQRRHNPAKMEIRYTDVVSITEEYTYRYNEKGYPTERTTTVTYRDGNRGSYVTKYFYEER